MIKAIIFDFDGVIIESAEVKTSAFRRLFAEEYPDKVDDILAYHRRNMGISRFVKFRYIYDHILKRPLSTAMEKALGDRFSGFVFDEVLKVPLVAGAMEFMISNAGRYSLFVASGTPAEELFDILKLRGMNRFFNEVYGTPGQKIEIINGILKKHSLNKNEVVFVGDAESDRSASESAGVAFIARVKSGDCQRLEDCKWKICDLRELDGILESVERQLCA